MISLFKVLAVSLFLLLLPAFVFAEEEITITTYYPSPNGVYKSLKAKRMAVGDTYFQQNWVDQGGIIPNDVNLTVEGKVGIGITSPTAMLEMGNNSWIMLNPLQAQAGINFFETGTKSATDVQYGGKIYYAGAGDSFRLVTRENSVDKYGISIARSTGDVGVGTASPAQRLDVAHDGAGIFGIRLTRNGVATGNSWTIWDMDGTYGNDFEIWQYPADNNPSCCIKRMEIQDNGDTVLAPSGGSVYGAMSGCTWRRQALSGSASNPYSGTLNCNSDEYVVSGGATCPSQYVLDDSRPTGIGSIDGVTGWYVDCDHDAGDASGGTGNAYVYVLCCKK